MDIREQIGMVKASTLCTNYAISLLEEKPEWAKVAQECAAIIDEAYKLALTNPENGSEPCQDNNNLLQVPEIDYTSGLPR